MESTQKMKNKNVCAVNYGDVLQKFFVPLIIKWVLVELVVILGLTLSFINEQYFIILFSLCTLLMFLISFLSQNNAKRMMGLLHS